jgi:hypothetical protein
MIDGLPFYVSFLFILTVLLSFWLFSEITRNKAVLLLLFLWLLLTGALAFNRFFIAFDARPPRFFLVVIIPLLAIVATMASPRTSAFINRLSLKKLTLLSIVRIPVECVLYLLFLYRQIPELMVFTGRNFDILAGLSAPIICLYCFKGEKVRHRNTLLIWHFIALALLLNIVINAVFSAPFPFQQFGFDQPNRAVFYFPFIWLPAFIVMAVLFSHLISIRLLLMRSSLQNEAVGSSI